MSWNQPSNRTWFLEGSLKNICKDKNVWDFCCGTGMNGIDALNWEAAHVTFTDVRKQSFEDFIKHGDVNGEKVNTSKLNKHNHVWKFLDSNKVLSETEKTLNIGSIDIIIYHGHFYHANNHLDILNIFNKSNAKHIIFETKCRDSHDFSVDWYTEDIISPTNAWAGDLASPNQHVLAASPTTRACDEFFSHAGFNPVSKVKQIWGKHDDPENKMCQYRVHYARGQDYLNLK